jgi:hypothetical protein
MPRMAAKPSDRNSVGQKAVKSGHEEAGEHYCRSGTKRSEFQNLRAPTLVLCDDKARGIHKELCSRSQMKVSSWTRRTASP